ncbi:hypothetical protein, partial [Oleiphilus sp. HI0079]
MFFIPAALSETNIVETNIVETHAIALYGEPKYPDGFEHFDWVKPDAPKGGQLRLMGFGTFDSTNP